MLLGEYSLTPGVFAAASYSSEEVCDIRLTSLKEVLLNEGLVRNLRDGSWLSHLLDNSGRWHRRGLELLHKLQKQGRLLTAPPALPNPPEQESDWCREALRSHRQHPLTGIVVSDGLAEEFSREPEVSAVGRLDRCPWWQNRRASVAVQRTTSEYLRHLDLVLRHASHLMFIDPHLDPAKRRYAGFVKLLLACRRLECPPLIELHRVWYEEGTDKRDKGLAFWKERFGDLGREIGAAGLRAKVLLWEDFHNRRVISNLVGIACGNGFDEQPDAEPDTWSRLHRDQRDTIQRDFDPATGRGRCHSFTIGVSGATP